VEVEMAKAICPEKKEAPMLVLSRRMQESVVIGGSPSPHPVLKVTVLEIRGGNVKLGFEADPDIPVQRSEVWGRMRTREEGSGPTEEFGAAAAR
jgi:carbon storage regulator CsrA